MKIRLNILVLLLCVFFAAPVSAETATQKPIMTVTLAQAEIGVLQTSLEAHGKAVPRDTIVVATDLTGICVVEVLVEAGDMVKKGQVLARLDTSSLQHSLDALQADLSKAEIELKRVSALRGTGAVSQQDVDNKKAAFLMLRSQTADARLRLGKAEITAPAAGLLYQRNIDTGSLVQTSSTLFCIASRNEIELEVAIPEAFSHAITHIMEAEVHLSHTPTPLVAKVRLVSPMVDAKSRTVSVRLALADAPFIPVGTYCTARFSVPAGEGLLIPAAAILQDIGGLYAWSVEDDGIVTRRAIQVLASNTESALVQGITEHTSVVARAGSFLHDGDRIIPAKKAP